MPEDHIRWVFGVVMAGATATATTLSGDAAKKSEGRSDQRRGTLKEKKGHLKDLFK
jgi:hypothetical protein